LNGKGHVGSWHDSDEPIIGQQKEFQRQFKAVLAITLANQTRGRLSKGGAAQ
jgi:hypothetical protein